MISRHWTGVARSGQVESYVNHLRTDTFPQLSAIPGFVRAAILRREVDGGTEFRIVTEWASLAAIRAFAGHDFELAVVPPVVQAMMDRYDARVAHYEIADVYPG
ncbi:MAG TPA: antibiotic biosynthesis monooxygenase [Methylomirabilota bacterium]|nr:antibiotic biosynthesis monooxygenase [Methylomirabilota bacterium]